MHLRLRRSQRAAGLFGGKVVFILDALVDLSPEEASLVQRHRLGKTVVYDSEARKKHQEAAYGHFDDAMHTPGLDAKALGHSLWSNARGLASGAMMAFALRVTVDSLVRGQHIEAKDLQELLGAEKAIVEGCQNLGAYLNTSVTFDGREDLLGF